MESFDCKTNKMKGIKTTHEFPPIPIRDYDWSAVMEDYDEGDIIGYGRTEQDAINDLMRQKNDR